EWLLLDTETTGLVAPIYVVELAAQRMCGWEPVGEPFRKLLNQNQDIPPEAARVHGYTREILERDGEPPQDVYAAFASYAGSRPLVSYHLKYDLDDVLQPEWKRLNVAPIGRSGFCALRLAQRLLDPVSAGNCKLQTLRQYYRLTERGAHTASGDVATVADLLANVLRPIAEQRGLTTWKKVTAYAAQEWYPTRLSFGKFKGQSFWLAQRNNEIRGWLRWLAESDNPRTARMGGWYLRQLDRGTEPEVAAAAMPSQIATQVPGATPAMAGVAVVIYVDPEVGTLRELVAVARARLAGLEAGYTSVKAKVDALQAELFKRLRPHYQKRDRLRLIVNYRKAYWETLLREGEDAAGRVTEEFQHARARNDEDYRQTQATMEGKHPLSASEDGELLKLWKNLVKLYHPDRFATAPEKLETYSKLTSAINQAKDSGDMKTLRLIADDPAGFIMRHGWSALDFAESREAAQLRSLWESLEAEIVAILEGTNQLKESAEYELWLLTKSKREIFELTVVRQTEAIEREVADLRKQAEELARQIEEVGTGKPASIGRKTGSQRFADPTPSDG
ncbi:MAG: exonuclease domain-containing protein, partial [Opitutaceae bacterium]